MVVYDFFNSSIPLITIFLLAIIIIISFIGIYQIWCFSKIVKKSGGFSKVIISDYIIRLFIVGICIVFLIGVSIQAVQLTKISTRYMFRKYEECSGSLTNISVGRDDYRGSEEYNIAFSVNEMYFQDCINKYSKEEKEKICVAENKSVSIQYTEIKGKYVIYRIILNNQS